LKIKYCAAREKTGSGFVHNQEIQYYTAGRLKNTPVENGNLLIQSFKEEYTDADILNKTVDASTHS